MDIIFYLGVICSNVFSVLFSFNQAVSSISFTEFRAEPHFDGYRCKPSDTVFELKRSNLLSCSRICYTNSYCDSVFYQPDFEECLGCNGFYHNDVHLNGSKYVGRYAGSCYPGWTEGGRYCYYISFKKTNWTYASSECRRIGGDLLDISDAGLFDENEGLDQLWTDVKYDPESRTYFSTSNGNVINENIIFYGVASAEKACVYYDSTSKYDIVSVSCLDTYNFVCKPVDKGNL